MLSLRTLVGAAAALALVVVAPASVRAQGVTTGALTGTITDDAGQGVEGAQVQLRNARTGLNIGTLSRASGLYSIQGIAPDNDYTIVVRRIGYAPLTRTGVVIPLGQTRREDFKLSREAAVLSTVTVTATTDPVINATKSGATTTISDSALRRLPTLNRNFSDFVQLVPQVSTTVGIGLSGGGVNLRQNAIQIDGAQSGDLFGLGTSGQPGAQANAKSIPLDAVKEYQVLLSPYDVRQGNFGGLLINAVTKSGTNEFHGTLYANTRNQNLTRSQSYLTDFSQQQYSASFGGPIVKDKLFFFLTGEMQEQQTPALGAFIGASDPVVSQASIDGLNNILATRYNYTEAGTGELVQKENPNRNLFARIDAYLPYSTRLVLRHNYAGADNTTFSRGNASANNPNFNLTSNRYEFSTKTNSTVGEFLTNLPSGLYNELLLNYTTTKDFRTVPTRFPQLTIQGIPRVPNGTPAPGTANFVVGTEGSSQGNSLDQRTFELTDNFTIPVGTHAVTLGTKNLFYRSINLFGQNSLGNWRFSDTTALKNGVANQYQVSAPSPVDPAAGLSTINAAMYSLYVQDAWTVTPTLSIVGGVRWDKPNFKDTPPENASVFTEYGRHTSSVPTKAQFSPRLSFNWDVTGDQRNQLRGGIGQFSGPPPFVYLSNAFGNSGLSGFASLTCNNGALTNASTASTNVPTFNQASIDAPPTSCAPGTRPNGTTVPGATIAASSNIATIDPDFRFPKYTKITLGYDRRLPWDLVGTLEGLYTRSANNAFYQNLALAGPVVDASGNFILDRNGRVRYGNLTATGAATNFKATPSNRQQVIDVTNSSGDYTWSTTAQVQKTFSMSWEGSLAYTYQQSRDVVSVTSSTQGSNFRYQRDVSGVITDMSLGRSKYDQPHRIVATGTYHFPSLTDISFIYTGNSGAPFDYVYGTNGGTTGDLNADGQSQNDLIYVPKNALDPNEIIFVANPTTATAAQLATAATQAQAFENFIANNACLNEARGTIMTRNACRNPWVNEFDVSFAQTLSPRRFQNVQLRLDIINFGNLLNRSWGTQAFSDQNSTCGQICSATVLLTHTGNVVPTGAPQNAQGIFTYDPGFKAFNADNPSSNYRMQLSLRYSF
jgi:hypothetical protein